MTNPLAQYDWSNWLYGLWKSAIGGGAQAAYSAITLIVVDPTDFNLQTSKFWAVVGAMFLYGAVKDMLKFLEKQSAPEIIAQSRRESLEISQVPMSGTGDGLATKTVKTTTEEKVEAPSKKEG